MPMTMIVDDETSARKLLRAILEKDGHEVVEAAGVTLAQRAIAAGHSRSGIRRRQSGPRGKSTRSGAYQYVRDSGRVEGPGEMASSSTS
jgi:CheY-like chemotaxis protein